MLMENKFGKISRITACAALKNGKTILEDLSFTAPYKIMAPFEKENGGIQIMPLCASAGIMEGDSQEFSYHVKEGRISRSCRSRLRRSTKWTRDRHPAQFLFRLIRTRYFTTIRSPSFRLHSLLLRVQ